MSIIYKNIIKLFGLILGRKFFQRPFKEDVPLLNGVQQVYLENRITIA
jgi:class I fructose-bisphosphate aldolase